MLRRNIWQPVGCLLLVIAILAGTIQGANAASSGGNGLRVSPVRTDATINPGETKTLTITVTNVTTTTANLQAIINDFTANKDESGNPSILLDATQYASSHSLKRYILPIGKFTLQPGQQKAIPISVKIPANASAGGYFGAVRFAPATNVNGPNQTVSLAGSVGSLILVKVPGDVKSQLSIASFNTSQNNRSSTVFTNNKGINAIVRFKNTGNIQEQPYGKILLRNRSGKILSSSEVNNTVPPGNVLPDSIRKFPVQINNVGSWGKFKLEGNFGYGSGGQLLSATTTFYVIPILAIYGVVFIILLILFLIFGLPRLIRSYNRRVLRKASRR